MFDKIYSDPFTRRVVRNWALRLGRRPVFAGVEREDLEQELWLKLWEGLPRFDPQVAHRNKLIVTIVARASAKLIRAALIKMRDRRGQSLEAMLDDDDDSAEQLAVADASLAAFEFDHDLATILHDASAELCELARQLASRTVSQVARDTGIKRGVLRRRVDRLRDLLATYYFGETS